MVLRCRAEAELTRLASSSKMDRHRWQICSHAYQVNDRGTILDHAPLTGRSSRSTLLSIV
jgi:hypothetical protein